MANRSTLVLLLYFGTLLKTLSEKDVTSAYICYCPPSSLWLICLAMRRNRHQTEILLYIQYKFSKLWWLNTRICIVVKSSIIGDKLCPSINILIISRCNKPCKSCHPLHSLLIWQRMTNIVSKTHFQTEHKSKSKAWQKIQMKSLITRPYSRAVHSTLVLSKCRMCYIYNALTPWGRFIQNDVSRELSVIWMQSAVHI